MDSLYIILGLWTAVVTSAILALILSLMCNRPVKMGNTYRSITIREMPSSSPSTSTCHTTTLVRENSSDLPAPYVVFRCDES